MKEGTVFTYQRYMRDGSSQERKAVARSRSKPGKTSRERARAAARKAREGGAA